MNTGDKVSSIQNAPIDNVEKATKEIIPPSEENVLAERFDEADPLHDRTPSGDSGPEDEEKTKGLTDSQASY